jgi:hypothetical protein
VIEVPGHSRLEVEIAIAEFNKYKSPGNDEIPAELIEAEGEILLSAPPPTHTRARTHTFLF